MRILIFNFEYPPLGGGGGVATKQLAEALAERHEVHVVTSAYKELPRQEVARNVVIHRVPIWGRTNEATATLVSLITFVPTALFKGWSLLREEKWDVINAQFVIPSGLPAAILARVFKVPLVVSFIGGDLYDPSKGTSPHRNPLIRWLVRWISSTATACTAISHDTKVRAQELHGVTKEIVVTHLGLIPQSVQPASRNELGLPADVLLAVSVGRLIPRKGYDTLLKVIRSSGSDLHLAIIGEGPLHESLQDEAIELGVDDRVHFMGFLPEERKLQVLAVSDVYVSAAEHEGFGIVLLEAMQAGLPIVAYNEGGHVDFLTPDENALLVPVGDSEALIAGLLRIVQDESLQRRLGEANRSKVQEFYLKKTAARFEEVLQAASRAL